MIRPLRARHRRLVLGVGIVAGALMIAGLAVRRPMPRVDELTVHSGRPLRFADSSVRGDVRVGDAGVVTVVLQLTDEAPESNLAIYWVPGEQAVADTLPEVSFWLGHLARSTRRSYRIPRAGQDKAGSIVLYSLQRQEVLDHARLTLPAPADGGTG